MAKGGFDDKLPLTLNPDYQALKLGDKSGGVDCFYERVDPATAAKYISQKQSRIVVEHETSLGAYGRQCPRCKKALVIYYEYHTSDGHYGYEKDEWVCEDANCGMVRHWRKCGY